MTTKPRSEIQIQAEAYQWLHNTHPETRGLCFHVPNGGSRNAIEGMQLKASGVVAGIPDIIFLWEGKAYGFEFKTASGHVSPIQDKIHKVWQSNGVPVYVVRCVDEFQYHIGEILSLAENKPNTSYIGV